MDWRNVIRCWQAQLEMKVSFSDSFSSKHNMLCTLPAVHMISVTAFISTHHSQYSLLAAATSSNSNLKMHQSIPHCQHDE